MYTQVAAARCKKRNKKEKLFFPCGKLSQKRENAENRIENAPSLSAHKPLRQTHIQMHTLYQSRHGLSRYCHEGGAFNARRAFGPPWQMLINHETNESENKTSDDNKNIKRFIMSCWGKYCHENMFMPRITQA